MLVRLVKMTFKEEAIATFQDFFQEKKNYIKGFDGCQHLQLLQDSSNPAIFFTLSYWSNEAALSHYRNSSFFRETWAFTKTLFAAKPEANSLNTLALLTDQDNKG